MYVPNPSMICMYMIVFCVNVVFFIRLTKTGDDTGSTLLSVLSSKHQVDKLNPTSKYCSCLQHLSLWPKAVRVTSLQYLPPINKLA